MPHTILISGEPAIARVSADGAIDVSYWRWVLYDALHQARSAGATRIILDLRTADLHVDNEQLPEVGATVRRLLTPDISLAAVIPHDALAGLEATPDGPANDAPVRFFTSDEAALRWLQDRSREEAA